MGQGVCEAGFVGLEVGVGMLMFERMQCSAVVLLERPVEKPFQNGRRWRHERVAFDVVARREDDLRAMGEADLRRVLRRVEAQDGDLADALRAELVRQGILRAA